MRESLHCLGVGLLLSTLGGLTACGPSGDDPALAGDAKPARIEGAVFYRERIMLPPGAAVEVQLQDISRADAMATVLATVLLTPQGGPPYDFAIEYDPGRIDPRMRYALRATISLDEQLLFSSNEYIDPFGETPVQILVQRVPEAVKSDQTR